MNPSPVASEVACKISSGTTSELEKLGFVSIGFFDRDGSHVRKNLVQHANRFPALYAFAIDREVMYIGKTVKPLSSRLHFYTRPSPRQSTNIRNNASIQAALSERKEVEIWALVDWEIVEHRGIPVNIAAGIEDELIRRMSPPWNGSAPRPC